MPLVSIIIPAYNAEKTIEACLDSISLQTYQNLEIIVVDDGSGDRTYELACRKAEWDSRIKVLRQTNAGVSAARNRGIQTAKGTFVGFVDSDDTISPCYMEKMTASAMVHPDGMPVAKILRSDGQENQKIKIKGTVDIPSDAAYEFLCGSFGQAIAFSVWNKLFNREKIMAAEISFCENVSIGEDMLFVLEYLNQCRTVTLVEDAVYLYKIDAQSAMNAARDYTAAYEKLAAELKKRTREDVLGSWALHAETIILGNPFIRNKSLTEFQSWWEVFFKTELCSYVKTYGQAFSAKRKLLLWLTKKNCYRLIYLCLQI